MRNSCEIASQRSPKLSSCWLCGEMIPEAEIVTMTVDGVYEDFHQGCRESVEKHLSNGD